MIGVGPSFIGGSGAAAAPATTDPPATLVESVTGPAVNVPITPGALVSVDTSHGAVSLVPPATGTVPVGTFFGVTDTGNSASTTPINIGGLSIRIEDPNAPGAFSSGVQITHSSQTVWWEYGPTPGPVNGWKIVNEAPSAGAGLLVLPSLAYLSGVPSGAMPTGSLAFVQSVGAYWTLNRASLLTPDGITCVAAAVGNWERGATGIALQAQAQLAWFVDAANASGTAKDENDGLTAATALRRKAEIVRRWGTNAPTVNGIEIVITYLSSEADYTDSVYFAPYLVGGSLSHVGALPAPSFVGTLLVVTAKSIATNKCLSSTFTTTSGAMAAALLLVNTARGSRAFAQRPVSGNWQITQPMLPGTVTAMDDTWAAGDAIQGYALSIVELGIGGLATQNELHTATLLTLGSATSDDATQIDLACGPDVEECVFAGFSMTVAGNANDASVYPLGFFKGCLYNGPSLFRGSRASSSSALSIQIIGGGCNTGGSFLCSGCSLNAVILRGISKLEDVKIGENGGSVFLDSGATIQAYGRVDLMTSIFGSGFYNQIAGTLAYNATAVVSFPLVTGLKLNGRTTAYSNATAAGTTTVHNLALTPAALDAAAGAAGFGGLAYCPGVAAITNGLQP